MFWAIRVGEKGLVCTREQVLSTSALPIETLGIQLLLVIN